MEEILHQSVDKYFIPLFTRFYTSHMDMISSINRRNLFKETEGNDSVLIFEEVPLLPQPKWHSKLRCWALSNTRPFERLHETTAVDTCLSCWLTS